MTVSLLLATLLAPTGATVDLAPKAYRTWKIELPADPFHKLSGAIPVPHANGDGFAVESRGVGFAIDTDGDGTLDRVVEGREHPETKVRHARVVLTGKTKDGADLRYPVRLEDKGQGWHWAAGGALIGDVDGTPVQLIDMDGNGRHDDVGRDAIVVGGTGIAQFLGESVAMDDELLSIHVEGARLTVAPYDGPTGTLDLHGEFDGNGVLLSAVVQSTDGKQSFELSMHEDGLRVPTGDYRLVAATLGLGDSRVVIDPAAMDSMEVAEEGETALEWGAPIRATFKFTRPGGEITLDPRDVEYRGSAGEKWIGWNPIGKSPTFHIKEKTTGDVLVDVVFPGSC